MNDEIAAVLLRLTASTSSSTSGIVTLSGLSPNTVVSYLQQLENRGLVTRTKARRLSRGRPAVVNMVTADGLKYLASSEKALYSKLETNEGAVWGPTRSFAHWGVPFFGRPEVFVGHAVLRSPIPVVQTSVRDVFENTVDTREGRFPSRAALVHWAVTEGEPRQIAAAALLAANSGHDRDRLIDLAATEGFSNRLGFLMEAIGATGRMPRRRRGSPTETMLRRTSPVDAETTRRADRWNVRNPLTLSLIREMRASYGTGH